MWIGPDPTPPLIWTTTGRYQYINLNLAVLKTVQEIGYLFRQGRKIIKHLIFMVLINDETGPGPA